MIIEADRCTALLTNDIHERHVVVVSPAMDWLMLQSRMWLPRQLGITKTFPEASTHKFVTVPPHHCGAAITGMAEPPRTGVT